MPRLLRVIGEDYARHKPEHAAFVALSSYRFGRWALQLKSPPLRWTFSKAYGVLNFFVANATKIWIPPQVRMGDGFHIIHASGCLAIHPDVVIGDRCGVMHNVTIGTNMSSGVPRIGDDVFIGANSSILGPITIGDRVRIGANVAVSVSVPPDSIVLSPLPRILPNLPSLGVARNPSACDARLVAKRGKAS